MKGKKDDSRHIDAAEAAESLFTLYSASRLLKLHDMNRAMHPRIPVLQVLPCSSDTSTSLHPLNRIPQSAPAYRAGLRMLGRTHVSRRY